MILLVNSKIIFLYPVIFIKPLNISQLLGTQILQQFVCRKYSACNIFFLSSLYFYKLYILNDLFIVDYIFTNMTYMKSYRMTVWLVFQLICKVCIQTQMLPFCSLFELSLNQIYTLFYLGNDKILQNVEIFFITITTTL